MKFIINVILVYLIIQLIGPLFGIEPSQLRWYRRNRGGRWAKVGGWLYGHRWVQVTDACVERVDEVWGAR